MWSWPNASSQKYQQRKEPIIWRQQQIFPWRSSIGLHRCWRDSCRFHRRHPSCVTGCSVSCKKLKRILSQLNSIGVNSDWLRFAAAIPKALRSPGRKNNSACSLRPSSNRIECYMRMTCSGATLAAIALAGMSPTGMRNFWSSTSRNSMQRSAGRKTGCVPSLVHRQSVVLGW